MSSYKATDIAEAKAQRDKYVSDLSAQDQKMKTYLQNAYDKAMEVILGTKAIVPHAGNVANAVLSSGGDSIQEYLRMMTHNVRSRFVGGQVPLWLEKQFAQLHMMKVEDNHASKRWYLGKWNDLGHNLNPTFVAKNPQGMVEVTSRHWAVKSLSQAEYTKTSKFYKIQDADAFCYFTQLLAQMARKYNAGCCPEMASVLLELVADAGAAAFAPYTHVTAFLGSHNFLVLSQSGALTGILINPRSLLIDAWPMWPNPVFLKHSFHRDMLQYNNYTFITLSLARIGQLLRTRRFTSPANKVTTTPTPTGDYMSLMIFNVNYQPVSRYMALKDRGVDSFSSTDTIDGVKGKLELQEDGLGEHKIT